jgi:hypothetical protein
MTLLGIILLLLVVGGGLYVIQISSLDAPNKNILRGIIVVVLILLLIYALAPGLDVNLFPRR